MPSAPRPTAAQQQETLIRETRELIARSFKLLASSAHLVRRYATATNPDGSSKYAKAGDAPGHDAADTQGDRNTRKS